MRISLSDFGPIAKGDVELRPLTVFIGPSNTGKSYLSTLIYSLHKSFREAFGEIVFLALPPTENKKVLSVEEDAQFAEWLETCKPTLRKPAHLPPLPSGIRERMTKTVAGMPGFGQTVQDSLERCFGVEDLRDLCRSPKGSRAKVSVSITGPVAEARIDATIGSKVTVRTHAPTDYEHQLKSDVNDPSLSSLLYSASTGPESWRHQFFSALTKTVTGKLFAPLARTPHFLPADRTGIMDAHRVIVNSLVDQASNWGSHRSPSAPGLSGTLTDFLKKMIYIDDKITDFGQEAHNMEEGILDGKIVMERAKVTNASMFFYLPQGANGGQKIPLLRSSSMVSELAPVVLHLRHVVRKGNLLIIEEPEAHLHPAMQARLAVQLAGLARRGLKVIVTTHSEWLLEQFSNLVGLSMLAKPKKKEIESSYPQLSGGELSVEDVGMWLFSPGKGSPGSTVTEIGFDRESTDFPTGFSDVSQELYSEWTEISSSIAEATAL